MSAKWNGGKCKGGTHVKAVLRHNDKKTREITGEHANEFLDKNETYKNYSFIDKSYEEKCEFYDSRIEELKKHSSLRKNSVTMQSIVIYPPDNFPDEKLKEFFRDSMIELTKLFGEKNLVNADVHFDEIHEYIDAETKELKMSKAHLHLGFIPEVNGRICCREFSTRVNMIKVNNALDEMCKKKFGVPFLSGKGKEERELSFEEQKKVSTDLMMEIREDLTQINENLTKENKSLSADNETLKVENKALEKKSENLSSECRELQEDLDSLASECSKVQSEVSELKKAKQQLRSECEKLQGYARKALTESERAMFREIKERHPEMVEQVRKEAIEDYNRLNYRASGRNTPKDTDISLQR